MTPFDYTIVIVYLTAIVLLGVLLQKKASAVSNPFSIFPIPIPTLAGAWKKPSKK